MVSITLSTFDPRWKQEFEQARSDLLWASEGYLRRVEHIGSTAIEDMIAVPEIDLLAGVAQQADMIALQPYLIGLGFQEELTEIENDMPLTCYAKPRRGVAGQRVFVTTVGCVFWQQALWLRDRLRENAGDADSLRLLKQHVSASLAGDPTEYARRKQIFWAHLLDQIAARQRHLED